MRGDMKARYDAYGVAKQWGFISTNEIRALENMPAVAGGDIYETPMNMTSIEGET